MSGILVAAAQTAPRIGEVTHNLTEISRVLKQAAGRGARLVVFPECALNGYNHTGRAEALAVAETLPGPASQQIADICREQNVFSVFGLLEKDGERLYNSAALVGPAGLIGVYRKTHLPTLGVDRFLDPGAGPLEAYDTPLGKIGILICYDSVFPECPRVLALKGAEILALPTNFPEGKAVRVIEHVLSARTIENRVYLVAANRVGSERGTAFAGRSRIIDPTGEVLTTASANREELILAEIQPETARNKRVVVRPGEYETDYVGDRRPELYGDLTA
jgi:5-aminopentanamidase